LLHRALRVKCRDEGAVTGVTVGILSYLSVRGLELCGLCEKLLAVNDIYETLKTPLQK